MSDGIMYDRWFIIALLMSEFGQVWARFNIEQCAKYHTTLDNIVGLGNRIAYEIAYDFGRDRTTAQLCSCLT